MTSKASTPTCSTRSDPMTNNKRPTMTPRPRNPFVPEYQRPERYDETWERRRDPIGFRAVQEATRRGY